MDGVQIFQSVIQGGCFTLLAWWMIWGRPAEMKEAREEREKREEAVKNEREKRDERFERIINDAYAQFNGRTDKVINAIEQQTKDLEARFREGAEGITNAVEKSCKVPNPIFGAKP
jgi:hypothetical protein